MNELRVWLAYYIMPKDTRKYLIKALQNHLKELEREITEILDEMNAAFYTHDNIIKGNEIVSDIMRNCTLNIQPTEDKEIKVGDEIVLGDAHVVVTYISPVGEWDEWDGFLLNDGDHGKQGQGYTCMSRFKDWRRTGRHFYQIAEVLSAWGGKE